MFRKARLILIHKSLKMFKEIYIGIRNTTTVFDLPQKDRIRKVPFCLYNTNNIGAKHYNKQPRLIPADGILRPFSHREALGQYWLKDLNNGAYQKDFYVAHISAFTS